MLSYYFLLKYQRHVDLNEPNIYDNMYTESIRKTIQLGGDTDTNACIVGGMIGALVGIRNIPQEMVKKVLDFDCMNPKSRVDCPRPEFLSVRTQGVKNIT